ncbi:hypothetical protein J437_LFUL019477 [Ladona fulva]|uniref:Uncharacterized protein n=1 Tax=Ladona fulva TaxID=123851 RepID=A0A8K0KQY8_LADFU|nr:hypothetical protein J437_LFUL019477 [Ladona fulva]
MKIDVKGSTSEFGDLQTFYIQGIFAVPPTKPAGYEYFPGVGYYKFYADGVNTFNEALNICQNEGAHLAIKSVMSLRDSVVSENSVTKVTRHHED